MNINHLISIQSIHNDLQVVKNTETHYWILKINNYVFWGSMKKEMVKDMKH
jgi:hypothetical protein